MSLSVEPGVEAERRERGGAGADRGRERDHAESRAHDELRRELRAEHDAAVRLREERRRQGLVPELARDRQGAEQHGEHVADRRGEAVEQRGQVQAGRQLRAAGVGRDIGVLGGPPEEGAEAAREERHVADQQQGEQPPHAGREDLLELGPDRAEHRHHSSPPPTSERNDSSSPDACRCSALSSTSPRKAAWPTRPGSGSSTTRPCCVLGVVEAGLVERRREARPVGRVDDGARRRLELEARQRARLHEPAARDDHDVVDALLHLAQQVRAHQHRAALVRQALQEAADPLDALGVEAVDRLVEHEHAGVAEQGVRERRGAGACRGSSRRPGGRRTRRGPPARARPARGRRAAPPPWRTPSGGCGPSDRDGSSRRAPPPPSRGAWAGRDTACRRTWPCPRSRAPARAAPAASWSCLRRSDRGTRSPGRAPP